MVESEAEQIYERALHEDVAFLVVGDPLWYCTDHTLLFEYACSSSSSSSSVTVLCRWLCLMFSFNVVAIYSATTHTDLMLRARNIGVKVEVIHNASAMGAAAASGLQVGNGDSGVRYIYSMYVMFPVMVLFNYCLIVIPIWIHRLHSSFRG